MPDLRDAVEPQEEPLETPVEAGKADPDEVLVRGVRGLLPRIEAVRVRSMVRSRNRMIVQLLREALDARE